MINTNLVPYFELLHYSTKVVVLSVRCCIVWDRIVTEDGFIRAAIWRESEL